VVAVAVVDIRQILVEPAGLGELVVAVTVGWMVQLLRLAVQQILAAVVAVAVVMAQISLLVVLEALES
jgi:hypothetical protein